MPSNPNTFYLSIASVGETLFDGPATAMTAPTTAGEITVLPHHEALVTTLKQGTIEVRNASDETRTFPVESGVLEIANNRVVVLL